MKILYREAADGEGKHYIYHAIYSRDLFQFSPSTNTPLLEKNIDETEGNKALCADLVETQGREDAEGDNKYCVDADGDIVEKEGWEERYGME